MTAQEVAELVKDTEEFREWSAHSSHGSLLSSLRAVAVQDLPENYAVCIKMFFYLDMNQEDISEMTGIPLNTVKSNIFRAKKILSEKLGGLL